MSTFPSSPLSAAYGPANSRTGSSNPDAEALIRAITRRDLLQGQQPLEQQQQQQLENGASATVEESAGSTALYHDGLSASWSTAAPQAWDSASLLSALDSLPETEVTAGWRAAWGTVLAGASTARLLGPLPGEGPQTAPAPGSAGPGPAPQAASAPPQQPLHLPEALRGLLASIAPASPLTARPAGSSLPYGARLPLAAPPPAVQPPAVAAAPSAAGTAQAAARAAAGGGWESHPGDTRQQGRQFPAAGPGRTAVQPLQPSATARGAAAAPLLYAAAGVETPLWAAALLPPSPPAPDLPLDPALEWALGLLSAPASRREVRPGQLRLANRIMAAHLGPSPAPQRQRQLPHSAAATVDAATTGGGGSGREEEQHVGGWLPWRLMLPVLDAVGGRLSPPAALALLRVISAQVGPRWRRELPPRDQAHLAATLRTCFRAALRSPDAVSASAAAGLLQVMCRLRLRSEPACALLVARILRGVVPAWRAAGAPPPPPLQPLTPPPAVAAPTVTAAAAVETSEQRPPASERVDAGGAAQQLHVTDSDSERGVATSSSSRSSSRRLEPSTRGTAGSGSSAPRGRLPPSKGSRGAGAGRRLRLGAAGRAAAGRAPGAPRGRAAMALVLDPRWRRAQLRWSCVALSTLAQLRISRLVLPRRALTKLLWAALFASAHWTPAVAAALPVWAARLHYHPPAAFLRRYSQALLGSAAAASDLAADSVAVASVKDGQQQQSQQRRVVAASAHRRHATRASSSDGGAAAATSPAAAAATCCSGRLVDRMTAPQLAAALEALVAHYGPCTATPEAVAAAAAAGTPYRGGSYAFASTAGAGRSGEGDVGRGSSSCSSGSSVRRAKRTGSIRRLALRYGGYRCLMHALTAALLTRLRQLRWQQLCRLPLLLNSVGQPEEPQGQQLAAAAAARGDRWQQAFVQQLRRQLPRCDVVALMLLLRGLAAGRGAGRDGADPCSTASASAMSYTYELLSSELADDALRRYTMLLPTATLYHTAAVLDSLSRLWEKPSRATMTASPAAVAPSAPQCAPPPPPSALNPPSDFEDWTTTDTTRVLTPVLEAAPTGPSASASTSPEADLRRRRLADLASERDFLLQQLDEHVAACLAYSPVVGRGAGGRRRARRSADGSGAVSSQLQPRADPRVRLVVGLVVKILTAYCRLQRPPAPRLQAALEAALLEATDLLGTAGWQAVRAAYRRLGLQPGPELSVALITFA